MYGINSFSTLLIVFMQNPEIVQFLILKLHFVSQNFHIPLQPPWRYTFFKLERGACDTSFKSYINSLFSNVNFFQFR